MAYISKEDVKIIRQRLKAEFGKRFKFSVTNDNHSGVRVSIMEMNEGDLDIIGDKNFSGYEEDSKKAFIDRVERGSFDVNVYWIEDGWNGETKKVLSKIYELCQIGSGSYDRNAGDMGADYCNMTYYIWMGFGKWDKPLTIKNKLAA